MHRDPGLDTLLALDGTVIDQESGYWVKFEVRLVEPSKEIPHGIRYSLTLHDKYGKRILGYDNSHGVRPPNKFKYAGQRLAYDHKHRHATDKGVPYEFTDAAQLLTDFFSEVDRVLKEVKR